MTRIVANYGDCAASGSCVAMCPEVFALGTDGVVEILEERPGPKVLEKAVAAVDACPTGCLDVIEDPT